MAIAVYGASGFVGRLVCDELARRGAAFVLAGRSRERLEPCADAAGGRPVRVAALDVPALTRALEGCRVVINCAGPSFRCGEPVLRAAIDSGVHYVDAAGEQPFIRLVFERFGDEAARRGVALVPGAGFDYAIGDCLARITAKPVEPAREVVVAYAIRGAGVGAASVQFAAETPRGHEVVFRRGTWRKVPVDLRWHRFDFPPPFGRQPVARYGAGEVITVPRHTRTQTVTTYITTASLVPHPALVPLFPVLRPLVAGLLQTPAKHLLGALAARLPRRAPQAPDRAAGAFAIGAVAWSGAGIATRGVATGTDFHGLTAAALAQAAVSMDAPAFAGRGALGAAAAFDPAAFLDGLRASGLSWRVEAAP